MKMKMKIIQSLYLISFTLLSFLTLTSGPPCLDTCGGYDCASISITQKLIQGKQCSFRNDCFTSLPKGILSDRKEFDPLTSEKESTLKGKNLL